MKCSEGHEGEAPRICKQEHQDSFVSKRDSKFIHCVCLVAVCAELFLFPGTSKAREHIENQIDLSMLAELRSLRERFAL